MFKKLWALTEKLGVSSVGLKSYLGAGIEVTVKVVDSRRNIKTLKLRFTREEIESIRDDELLENVVVSKWFDAAPQPEKTI